jgi:hypothetical protein
VSSSSDHQPGEPERRGPSTQEIPVVAPGATAAGPPAAALPPHPGAVTPPPVAMGEPQPTSPVDFVPAPSAPPVPPPAPQTEPAAPAGSGPVWPDTLESDLLGSGEREGREKKARRIGAPRDRAALLGLGLAVLSLALLELGLALDFGVESYWSAVPLWSAFATLCVVVAVLALAAGLGSRVRPGAGWRIAAGGLVGLAVFWVLVVLPVVASDRGFLLTAAVGALGAALWVGPGRKA